MCRCPANLLSTECYTNQQRTRIDHDAREREQTAGTAVLPDCRAEVEGSTGITIISDLRSSFTELIRLAAAACGSSNSKTTRQRSIAKSQHGATPINRLSYLWASDSMQNDIGYVPGVMYHTYSSNKTEPDAIRFQRFRDRCQGSGTGPGSCLTYSRNVVVLLDQHPFCVD